MFFKFAVDLTDWGGSAFALDRLKSETGVLAK
jgi:hypothetical protein